MNRQTNYQILKNRAGISLIEVVVSTLMVGFVLVASMKSVNGVLQTWQVTEEAYDATALAHQLMSEIMQAEYYEPGTKNPTFGVDSPEVATVRTDWDDTDDFDGWTSSPPEAKDGTALSGYTGWTRSVVVEKLSAADPTQMRSINASDKGLRRITITVTDPNSDTTTLVAFRSEYGSMEQKPNTTGIYVLWVGSELQVGSNAGSILAGTNVTNHAQDQ